VALYAMVLTGRLGESFAPLGRRVRR
jgi:hypothetical protein